ncbi:nitrate- and nitrite sensing domain-containing protein [Streptomyces sp. TRM76323]|uniref:histidine kinase n=1 Tax=Streptomyces tamarix TaxID=3078565 RepID=A0ABU3QMB3_9ACTN|nr:nitrate- and nitrite sensing domain-containing protein [Streptomyces tamarix]MDT9683900.1 nitrate- and nitrite sensing domain-containing protein [Streptomyces tamarix]
MQGRFKRDGSAAAEQEPRGGTDRGSSPQHTHDPGPAVAGNGGGRSGRAAGAAAGAEAAGAAGGGKGGKPGRRDKAGRSAKPGKEPKAAAPGDTGSRIALRNWRISTRLVSLLALPVVAATSLGGLRIQESMENMEQLDHMQLLTKLTREAHHLAQALQEERDLSAGPKANGYADDNLTIKTPRDKTDAAQRAFLNATDEIGDTQEDEALASIRANVTQIANQVVTLGTIRKDAYAKNQMSSATVGKYNRLIESLLTLSQDMAQATSNPEMIKRTRALAAFSSAKEYASMQRAIIAAALPKTTKNKAKLNENDRQYAEDARVNENAALKSFRSIYESAGGDATDLLGPLNSGNPSIQAADQYADRVLREPNGLERAETRTFLDWTDEAETKLRAMETIEATLLGEMESKARELRQEAQRDAIVNGALIILVLGVSLIGAFVVARSMITSLRRLQDTATRVAQERLPQLVKQLSEADPQDVDTSVESVGVHSRDEIGKVAAAFDDVHREAVRLAAEQALLRGNVNAMFTNLSRRSQGLIQRQLSLISELESREADPDQLSSLFKLDHLATRMRRNGENLLVLAGEEPGRRWTRPVPLVDVLRAAASEVEQYERIELASVPATEVAGRVVNDLVHLLAELLENATSFSSPQTKVRVTGHALPDGRVLVEIHDTGIGLSPEDLAAINERLASPPTVDVSVSRRMGLFVVGRLSLRHGIRIQLRPSDSGGTTALVMLPVDVTQGGKKPGGPGGPGGLPQGGSGQGGRTPGGQGGMPGGGRPGPGGPGQGGAPQNRLAAGLAGARGQVGAAGGARAALPGRDDPGGRPGGAQGGAPQGGGLFGGSQGGQPGRDGRGQGAGFPGAYGDQGGQAPQGGPARGGPVQGGAPQGGPAARDGIPSRSDVWQGGQAGQAPQGGQGQQRQQQLPPSGGPRAELPGGPQRSARPQPGGWAGDQGVPRSPLDVPRGHEEHEATGRFARPAADHQGPGSTAEFPRPDFDGPRPDPGVPQGGREPQDPAATAAIPRPDFGTPRPDFDAPRPDFDAPRQPVGSLPPAGAGDGRTPLYDTLETNWFHGQQEGRNGAPQGPAQDQGQGQGGRHQGRPAGESYPAHDQTMPTPVVPQPQQPAYGRPAPAVPQRAGQAPGQGQGPAGQGQNQGREAASTGWRATPNDELVRQAERVRKPAAGGVTTSGLPRRVPRANLVPGTAQEQPLQSGPQVSRAPDDVRGRLTNLRRGIQQGRQAGSGNTGSFHVGPTHQQEREF